MRNHKIDERKDNIRRIKETIENTQDNIEFANDMIIASVDTRRKQTLKDQNKRRDEYIDYQQNELKEKIGKSKKKK